MPLAALILGSDGDVDGDLPILFSVAGQTLVEYHARTARAHGAGHIVLVADRMPGPLLAALDRLKSAGIAVDVVRTAGEAADSIHPDEDVIVMSGGVVVRPDQLAALIDGEGSVLLTIPDTPENQQFERIDAQDRWTGVALLDGSILRETAGVLGDWQLGPTLLRMALQKGIRRMPVLDHASVSLLSGTADAARASAALAAHTRPESDDWVERYLIAPVAGLLAGKAMNRQVSVGLLTYGSAALVLAALALAVAGYMAGALAAFLLSALPLAVADILGQIGARKTPLAARLRRWRMLVWAALVLIAGGLGWWRGDGPLLAVLCAWAASTALLTADLPRRVAHPPIWRPGALALAAVMLPFFIAGQAVAGLAAAIFYLLAAQIWMQRNLPAA